MKKIQVSAFDATNNKDSTVWGCICSYWEMSIYGISKQSIHIYFVGLDYLILILSYPEMSSLGILYKCSHSFCEPVHIHFVSLDYLIVQLALLNINKILVLYVATCAMKSYQGVKVLMHCHVEYHDYFPWADKVTVAF